MLTTYHRHTVTESGGQIHGKSVHRQLATDVRTSSGPSMGSALVAVLQQFADVLERASDEQFVQQPVGVIVSSLGGHVRHCLDHFGAFLTGAESGFVDYDHRERGTDVERDRRAALLAIRHLQERLASVDDSAHTRSVRVRAMICGDGTSLTSTSTVGRELVFVLSHTIHHNALIAAICKTLGIPLPERFGYAPATIAHLAELACAR